MRVKVGGMWFDCKDAPIMVQLSAADKQNIANMPAEASRYAEFDEHDGKSAEDRLRWMDEGYVPEKPKA